MTYENIVLEKKETTAIITLNRPKVLNSLNAKLIAELDDALSDVDADKNIRVIVFTGAGRAFAAGKDIPEFIGKRGAGMMEISKNDHRVLGKIRNSAKLTIAAVNGMALGGGLELAMSCHIRVAAESAVFGLPEVTLGAIPGAGGTQLLPRLIGKGAALYHMCTAESIPSADAYRLGLVDKLVPDDKLMVTAMAIASVVARKGPFAVGRVIEAVVKGMELPLEKGLKLEIECEGQTGDSEDFNNAIQAFLDKKPVEFKGR